MQFEFTNINDSYNQINTDVLASITNENTNAAQSNISSIYDSAQLNLDAAVLSISNKGTAKMSAMLCKSIRLRASYSDPNMTVSERLKLTNSLSELRGEIQKISTEGLLQNTDSTFSSADTINLTDGTDTAVLSTEDTDALFTDETVDGEQLVAQSKDNILKYAEDSVQVQQLDRDRVLELL